MCCAGRYAAAVTAALVCLLCGLVVGCSSSSSSDSDGAGPVTDASTGDGARPDTDASTDDDAVRADISVSCPEPCGENASCALRQGEPVCVCNPGFEGDGSTCDDVDECAADPVSCPAGECYNLPGSYYCGCAPGRVWNGTSCAQAGLREIGTGEEHSCRIDASGEMR